MTGKYAGQLLLLLSMLVVPGTTASADTPIKVMTYNTHHGGTATWPPSTDDQLDTIAAENPDVVVLQEAYSSQLSYYVNGLNARMGTTAWHGSYARHCKAGTEPTCTRYSSEVVMVLTTLEIAAVTPRLVWANEYYFAARAALRVNVALGDGSHVNVFSMHLPALAAYRAARETYVNTFIPWAQTFGGPALVGGDFNDVPGTTPILAMTQQFADAWVLGGSGPGYTHSTNRRIDYWFSDNASQTSLSDVRVVGDPLDSDHLAVVATYVMPSMPDQPDPPDTTLMRDGFDALDATMWPTAVITGMRDATVPVGIENGLLRIGDLTEGTTGSSYNGISSGAYYLPNNGCASVQLVTPPSPSSTAYVMFAVVHDAGNYYRWYESAGELVAEKKIGGVKTAVASLPYDPNVHQFLRIRHAANTATGTQDVVYETAPNDAGVPGTFTELYREEWHPGVATTSLKFELKSGTSGAETAPGSAYFDNFHAVTDCRVE